MRFRIAAKIAGIAAGGMWGVAVAGIWAPVDDRALPVDLAGAGVLTLAAFGCVLADKLRDRVVERLADAVVASRRAAPKTTLPLRAVR